MVKLYAGNEPETEPFIVHKDWACKASPVLAAAFNSEFLEGQTQEYRLDMSARDGDVVQLLVSWIYTHKLELEPLSAAEVQQAPKAEQIRIRSRHSSYLAKLWVLADKLLMPRLQNEVIECFCKSNASTGCCFSIPIVRYIYENTNENSRLRKFLLYQTETIGPLSEEVADRCHELPPEFFFDVLELLKTKVPKEIRASFAAEKNIDKFKMPED